MIEEFYALMMISTMTEQTSKNERLWTTFKSPGKKLVVHLSTPKHRMNPRAFIVTHSMLEGDTPYITLNTPIVPNADLLERLTKLVRYIEGIE